VEENGFMRSVVCLKPFWGGWFLKSSKANVVEILRESVKAAFPQQGRSVRDPTSKIPRWVGRKDGGGQKFLSCATRRRQGKKGE